MCLKIIELCSKKISKIQWKLLKNKNIEKKWKFWMEKMKFKKKNENSEKK